MASRSTWAPACSGYWVPTGGQINSHAHHRHTHALEHLVNGEGKMNQQIIDLYDEFTHGHMERRDFLGNLAKMAGSM